MGGFELTFIWQVVFVTVIGNSDYSMGCDYLATDSVISNPWSAKILWRGYSSVSMQ